MVYSKVFNHFTELCHISLNNALSSKNCVWYALEIIIPYCTESDLHAWDIFWELFIISGKYDPMSIFHIYTFCTPNTIFGVKSPIHIPSFTTKVSYIYLVHTKYQKWCQDILIYYSLTMNPQTIYVGLDGKRMI